jgi:hypothetical protein
MVNKFKYNFLLFYGCNIFNFKINVIIISYGYNISIYPIIISITLKIICH